MAQYGDYCPLSRAAEIFATRWTPLIVRNLQMGCTTFNAIHAGVPGVSRTLLSQRLRMLEHHGILERPAGTRQYALTVAGQQLGVVCNALGRWGELWIELAPDQFDASKVLWALSVRIDEETLPQDRCVVRFDVAAPQSEHFWLVLDRPTVEVCRRPVGDHDDLVVRVGHAETLVRWHVGELSLGQAIHAGQMQVDGPRWLERLFASWGGTVTYPQVAGIGGPA